nr:tetratricopeptide repeat protein [bacterium]
MEKLIKKNVKDPAIYYDIAEHYISAGKTGEALEVLDKAAKTFDLKRKEYSGLIYLTAETHNKKKDYVSAEKHYLELINAAAFVNIAGLRIGNIKYLSGNYEEAIKYYELSARSNETYGRAVSGALSFSYLKKGTILFNQKKFKEAFQYFEKSIQRNQSYFRPYYYAGIILYNQGDYKKAEEYLRKSDSLKPESLDCAYYLGLTYFALKQYEDSERELLKSLTKNAYGETFLKLGDIAKSKKNENKTAEYYVKSLEFLTAGDKEKSRVLLELGKICELKEPVKSLNYYEQYLKNNISDFKTALKIGELYKKNNNIVKAKEYYNKYLSYETSNQEILLETARLEIQTGDYKSAETKLKTGLSGKYRDESLKLLSVIFASAMKHGEAMRYFSEIKNIKIYLPEELKILGKSAVSERMYETAEKIYSGMETDVSLKKEISQIKYQLALNYYNSKDYAKSIIKSIESVNLWNNRDNIALLAKSYYETGKFNEAEQILSDNSQYSKEKDFIRLIGFIYYRTKKFAKALPYLEKFKTEPEVMPALAEIYGYVNSNKQQIEILTKLAAKNPEDGKIIFELGVSLYNIGNFGESEKYLLKNAGFSRPYKRETTALYLAKLKFDYSQFSETVKFLEPYYKKLSGGADKSAGVEADFILGLSHYNLNSYGKALQYLTRIPDKSEYYKTAAEKLGIIYFKLGDAETEKNNVAAAANYYELSLKFRSSNELYLKLGENYRKQKNYKTAELYYLKAYETNPKSSEPFEKIALMNKETNQFETAVKYYEKAFQITKNSSTAYQIAEFHKNQKDYKTALYYFKFAEQGDKTGVISEKLGDMHYETGDMNEALKAYGKSLSLKSDNHRVSGRLAEIYFFAQNFSESEKNINAALSIEPKNSNYHFLAAKIKTGLVKYKEAAEHLSLAKQYGLTGEAIEIYEADLAFKKNDFRKSAESYKKLCESNNKEKLYIYRIGYSHIRMADYEAAENYLKQIPDYSDAGRLLAQCYEKFGDANYGKGKYDKALEYYQLSLKRGYSPEAEFKTAEIFKNTGKTDLALERYKTLLSKSAYNKEKLNTEIGMIYYGKRKYDSAKTHLESGEKSEIVLNALAAIYGELTDNKNRIETLMKLREKSKSPEKYDIEISALQIKTGAEDKALETLIRLKKEKLTGPQRILTDLYIAEIYYKKADYEAALKRYLAAYSGDMTNKRIMSGLAKTYYAVRDWEQSLKLFEILYQYGEYKIESGKYLSDANKKIAENLLDSRKYREAVKYYDYAYSYNQNDWESIFKIGECYYRLSDLIDAEQYFISARNLNKSNHKIYEYLYLINTALNKDNDALYYLKQAIQLKPSFEFYSAAGNLNEKNGNFAEAAANYNSALKYKEDGKTRTKLSELYLTQKNLKQSIAQLEVYIEKNPKDVKTLKDLLDRLYESKDSEKMNKYVKTLQSFSSEKSVNYYRGLSEYISEKKDSALESFKTAAANGYENAELFGKLGELYYLNGFLDLAYKYYKSAFGLSSGNLKYAHNAGKCALLLEKFGESIDLLLKSENYPGSKFILSETYRTMAIKNSEAKEYHKAAENIEKAKKIYDHITLNINLAEIYFQMRDYAKSISILNGIPVSGSKDIEQINRMLGISFYYSGELSKSYNRLKSLKTDKQLTEILYNINRAVNIAENQDNFYKKVLESKIESAPILYEIAVYYASKDKETSLELTEKILSISNVNPELKNKTLIHRGYLYYADGQINKSSEILNSVLKSIRTKPGDDILYLASLVTYKNSEYENFLKYYNAIKTNEIRKKLDDYADKTYSVYGTKLIESKKIDEAIKIFSQAVKKFPANIEHLLNLADCNYLKADYSQAAENYIEAEKQRKDSITTRKPKLLKALYETKKYEDAFKYVSADEINDLEILAIAAEICERTGKEEEAAEIYIKSLSIQPDIKTAESLIKILAKTGKIEQAAKQYASIAEISGKKELYEKSGDLYLQSGARQNALDSYIKSGVRKYDTYYKILKTAIELGKTDIAADYLKLIEQSGKIPTDLYPSISDVYYKSGDFVSAEKYLEKTVDIEKGNKEYSYKYSICLIKLKKYAQALKVLNLLGDYKDSISNRLNVLAGLAEAVESSGKLQELADYLKQSYLLKPDFNAKLKIVETYYALKQYKNVITEVETEKNQDFKNKLTEKLSRILAYSYYEEKRFAESEKILNEIPDKSAEDYNRLVSIYKVLKDYGKLYNIYDILIKKGELKATELFEYGKKILESGDNERALKILSGVFETKERSREKDLKKTKDAPKDALDEKDGYELCFLLGKIYYQKNDTEKSQYFLNNISNAYSENLEYNYYLSKFNFLKKNYQEAEKNIAKIKGRYGDISEINAMTADILKFKSGEYIKNNQLDKAAEILSAIITIMPDDDYALFNLAEINIKTGKPAVSEELLNKIKPQSVYFNDKILILADLNYIKGDYKKSFDYYKRAAFFLESKKNPELFDKFAESSLASKDINTALKYFLKSFEIEPAAESALKIGNIYYSKKDYKNSVVFFEKYSNLKPADIEIKKKLVEIYFAINDYSKAKNTINQILSADRTYQQGYLYLGEIYLTEGRQDKALNYFVQGLETGYSSDKLYKYLANLYYKKELYHIAYKYYLKVYDESIKDPEFLLDFIDVCVNQNKFDMAEKLLNGVALKNFKSGRKDNLTDSVIFNKSMRYYAENKTDSALEELDKLKETEKIKYWKGRIYYVKNYFDKAETYFSGSSKYLDSRRYEGLSLYRLGRSSESYNILKEFRADSEIVLSLYNLIFTTGGIKDSERISILDAVEKIKPQYRQIKFYRGELLERTNNNSGALKNYETIIADGKISANGLYEYSAFNAGRLYFNINEYDEAAKLFEISSAGNIRKLESDYFCGISNFRTKNYDKAEKSLELLSDRTIVKTELIEIYSVKLNSIKNEPELELETLEKILSLSPERDDLIYELSLKQFETGKIKESIKGFEKIFGKYPDYKEAGQYLVKSYFKINDVEKANKLLASGIDITNDRELLRRGSEIFLRQKKYKEAINFLVKLKLMDESADAYKNLGDAYLAESNFELAIRHYERYLELDKNGDLNLFKTIASLYENNGDSLKSYNYYKKYYDKGSRDLDVVSALAAIGKKTGQKEYIKFFEELHSLNPYDFNILKELFNYYFSDDLKRKKYFSELFSLINNGQSKDYKFDESTLDRIFEILFKNQNYAELLKFSENKKLNRVQNEMFEKSIERLADLYFLEKKYDTASGYYNRVFEFRKNKNIEAGDIQTKLGDCAYYKKDYKSAVAHYEAGVKTGEYNFKLGESYYKLNDMVSAKKYFNENSGDIRELEYLRNIFYLEKNRKGLITTLKKLVLQPDADYANIAELGILLFESGEIKESEKYLNPQNLEKIKKLGDESQNKKAFYYYGSISAASGKSDWESAIKFLEKGLDLNEFRELASFQIAEIYFSKKYFDQAEQYYKNIGAVNENFKKAEDRILEIAKINMKKFIDSGDYNSALNYSLKIAEKEPSAVSNIEIQIEILEKLKKYGDAIQLCDKIVELGHPDIEKIKLKQSELYKKNGDYGNWIKIISGFAEKNKKYLIDAAEYCEQSGKIKQALDFYGKYYSQSPEPDIAVKLADLYLKENNEPLALQYLLKLADIPEYQKTRGGKIADLLFKFEKYDELEKFLGSINKNNFKPEYYYYGGKAYSYLKKYDKAAEYYNLAVRNGYFNAELFESGAENSYLSGNYAQSVKFAEKGLELYSDKPEKLRIYAGKSYFELGDYVQAESYFSKLNGNGELKKYSDKSKFQIIKKLFESKKYADAIEKFKLIETDEIRKKLIFEAAKSYYRLNNFAEAEKYYSVLDKSVLTGSQNLENIYEYAFVKKTSGKLNEGFKVLSQNENILGERELKLYLEFSKKLDIQKEYAKTLIKLSETTKRDIDIILELAGYYFENGDYKNAIAVSNRTVSSLNGGQEKLDKLKYYLAVSYYKSGLYEAAEKYLFDLTSVNYPDKKLYTYYAHILNKTGDYVQSMGLLAEDKIDASMNNLANELKIDNSKKIIASYFNSKNFQKCRELFESLEKSGISAPPEIIFIAGSAYFYLDDFEKAEHLLKQSEKSGYEILQSKKILALIYETKSNYKTLENYYAALGSEDKSYLYKLGELYRKNDRIDSAIFIYEKLAGLAADDKQTGLILYELYSIKNEKQKAAELLIKYLTLEYNEKYALNLIKYYLENKDFLNALKWTGYVLKKNSKSGEAFFYAGLAEEFRGDYKSAEENFRNAGLYHYDESQTFSKLLYSLYKQNKTEQLSKLASEDYKKTLECLSAVETSSPEWTDIKIKCYYYTGDYEGASKILSNLIKTKKETPDINLAVKVFYKTGRIGLTESLINRAEESIDNLKIKYEISRISGDYAGEEKNIRAILKSKNAEKYYTYKLIELFYETGRSDKAVETFENSSFDVHSILLAEKSQILAGLSAFKLGKFLDAYKTLGDVRIRQKLNKEALYCLAYSAYKLDKIQEAWQLFTAIETAGKYANNIKQIKKDIYEKLGDLNFAASNFSKAIENYQSALDYDKSDTEVSLKLADSYYSAKIYSKAVELFASLEKNKMNPELFENQYGQALYNLGKEKEAAKYIAASAVKSGDYNFILKAAELSGKYLSPQKTIELYVAARNLTKDFELNKKLGDLFYSINDYINANRQYNLYLTKFPKDKLVMTRLVEINEKNGNNSETIKYLEELARSGEITQTGLKKLAEAYKASNDLKKSVEYFEKYALQNKNDPQILLELGRLNFELGNYKKSAEYYNETGTGKLSESDLTKCGTAYFRSGDNYDLKTKYYPQALKVLKESGKPTPEIKDYLIQISSFLADYNYKNKKYSESSNLFAYFKELSGSDKFLKEEMISNFNIKNYKSVIQEFSRFNDGEKNKNFDDETVQIAG